MKPSLLQTVGHGAVLLAVVLVLPSESPAQALEKGKVHRRIIVNDDGEAILPGEGKSWDDYLGERLADAVGTQVDSYFLNIGATDRGPGIVNSLQSSMAYWASKKETPAIYAEATRRYIDAARKADMEIFASIRMNDVHDSYQAGTAGAAGLTYPLKVQRPDLLMGSPELLKAGRSAYPPDSVMMWFWSGLDWAKADVRQHFLDLLPTTAASTTSTAWSSITFATHSFSSWVKRSRTSTP